jgi:hypothetical protein
MMKLSMTTLDTNLKPAIPFEQCDEFSDFHRTTVANGAAASMLRPNKTKLTGPRPPTHAGKK